MWLCETWHQATKGHIWGVLAESYDSSHQDYIQANVLALLLGSIATGWTQGVYPRCVQKFRVKSHVYFCFKWLKFYLSPLGTSMHMCEFRLEWVYNKLALVFLFYEKLKPEHLFYYLKKQGLYSFSSYKSEERFFLGFFLERTKQVLQMLSKVKSDNQAKHLFLHCLTEIGKDHMPI